MSQPLPPDVLRLARLHRLRQQTLAAILLNQMRRLWRTLSGDPQDSWQRIGPVAVAAMTVAQAEAARGADDYVAAVLAAQGSNADPAGPVAASAFAGHAADGRDLTGLLGYPAFQVGAFVAQGMDLPGALAIGGRHLDRMVLTEVADAARAATGVAIVNDRKARGWVRHVTPPSCSRCVILAGRWYRYSAGFARHP